MVIFSPQFKQTFLKFFHAFILPLLILAVFGVSFALIHDYNILGQSEAANTAIPVYDINKLVGITGSQLYRNINQDKYGKIEWVQAATGELLISLKAGQPLSEISRIAQVYNMDVLERYRKDTPSFLLRLSASMPVSAPTTSTPVANPAILGRPISLNPIIPTTNTNLIKSDGKLEQIWGALDADPRVDCVGLNDIAYPESVKPWGGYWPSDPYMNPADQESPGDKAELLEIEANKAWKELKDFDLPPGGDSNVWIAVLDTGIDLTHQDLAENIARDDSGQWAGRNYFPCEEGKYKEPCQGWIEFGGDSGGDGINNANNKYADYYTGHGTMVSGIAAEMGNDTNMAAGVAFDARIVPINVCDLDGDSGCPIKYIIEGLDYAASLPKVKVINLSIGGYLLNENEKQAIGSAWLAGKVIVAGVGNDNNDIKAYPAAFDNVIAAAGVVDSGGQKSEVSNFGDWVDISAIIDNVRSTQYKNTYGLGYGEQGSKKGGTSWAAPQVAGSIALLLSYHPDLKNNEAFDIITQNTNLLGDPLYLEGKLGGGLVDPYLAMVSKAPLFKTPKFVEKYTFNDIKFEWYAYPGTSPTKYWIDAKLEEKRPSFIPYDPDHPNDGGADLGMLTHFTFYAKDIDTTMKDGLWQWRVASQIGGKKYWTPWKYITKKAAAELIKPLQSPDWWGDIKIGDEFKWTGIDPKAKDQVVRLWYGLDMLKHLEISLGANTTSRVLTEAEYYALPGQKINWTVTGVSKVASDFISLEAYKNYLSKILEGVNYGPKWDIIGTFWVPIIKLWEHTPSFETYIGVTKGTTVTIINTTAKTEILTFDKVPESCDKILPATIAPYGGRWTHQFDIPCYYGFKNADPIPYAKSGGITVAK